MLYVRYTDPPSHIVGETESICDPLIDEGRSPVDEYAYAKLEDDEKARTPVIIRRPKRVVLSDDEVKAKRPTGVEDIALVNSHSPGDVVCMTAVVRELHKAHPSRFRTVVQTWFPELWANNPHITPEAEIVQPRRIDWDWRRGDGDCNSHFVNRWRDDLEIRLGVKIPMTDIRGDIRLTESEKAWPADLLGDGPRPFFIVVAGTKAATASKAWGTKKYQAVVDHFKGREFVQVGKASEHQHKPLEGATNLLDKTGVRDLIRLVYWSDLILLPITFVTHLSAAIPLRTGGIRPCVVISGGVEPPSLFHYDGHHTIGNIGSLHCCSGGACFRYNLPPSDGADFTQCLRPIEQSPGEFVGQCFDNISVRRVTDAVEASLRI